MAGPDLVAGVQALGSWSLAQASESVSAVRVIVALLGLVEVWHWWVGAQDGGVRSPDQARRAVTGSRVKANAKKIKKPLIVWWSCSHESIY